MKELSKIKSLVGNEVSREDLKHVDCYIHDQLGIFIPSTGACGYAAKKNHSHPAYMIGIFFDNDNSNRDYYDAFIVSPNIPHNDVEDFSSYYCIMIEQEYFEMQYLLYCDQIPYFKWTNFAVDRDILKHLNTYIFECSQDLPNRQITLDAQNTLITHWLIRNILGSPADIRIISSNYIVARIQHFIEKYYHENLSVNQLAGLANMSDSTFNRLFKKETGLTPIKYLIEVRIEKSKVLLRRDDLPITEIAARCGFGSSAHFSAEFKRLTTVTPSEYRQAYNH